MRVATACPEVAVGDIAANVERIGGLFAEAAEDGAHLVVFPELSLTGYTIGDLVQQRTILQGAEVGLVQLAAQTKEYNAAMVVGLPYAYGNALYNCAAVLSAGRVQGIVPKTHLPNDKEFYEKRWYRPWESQEVVEVQLNGQTVPFGSDMLFKIAGAQLGVEICEALWRPQPPSGRLAEGGATLIANPSASPEQVGKSTYRRALVCQQAARLAVAYVYASSDASESTTDIVMSGHQMIAEQGKLLAERRALQIGQRLTTADIDLDHIRNDRLRDANFLNTSLPVIECGVTREQTDLRRYTDPHPFVPSGAERQATLQEILDIQSQALATRLRNTHIKKIVIGLSGGLDSTQALIVAVQAARRLGVSPGEMITAITMPGEASSDRTQSNAALLANALNIPHEVRPINELTQAMLGAIGHDGITQDVTYENVQARLRTSILFNRANQAPTSLVLGTGDLSEIALGWSTYNGDHIAHYNVNASVPKTLMRHLVDYAAEQPAFAAAQSVLKSILDTPVSPELVRSGSEGISQETEEIIGPYELHDFFLYYLIRWNDQPAKIAYLANQAFEGTYSAEQVDHWLGVFLKRFTESQWKRSVATDGPKVGSVSLSPRGDWRMPSDMRGTPWANALQ
jgi:NAD+ synthase (glutamine-hydrolysing)